MSHKTLTKFGEIAQNIGSRSVVCNVTFGHQREGIKQVINWILRLMDGHDYNSTSLTEAAYICTNNIFIMFLDLKSNIV